MVFLPGIFAQKPPDYRLISGTDGLSHRDVKYTTRDPRGFLWIINSGIDFYDGQTFTAYNKFDPEHYIPIDNIRTGCKVMDTLLVFTAAKDLYALNMLTGKCRPMAFPEGMNTDFNDVIAIVERQHQPNLLIFTRSNTGTTIHVIDRNWKYLFHYEVGLNIPLRSKILRTYANGPDSVIWLLDQANAQLLHVTKQKTTAIPFMLEVNKPNLVYRLVYIHDFGLVICRNDGNIFAVRDGTQDITEIMHIPVNEPVLNPSHVTADGWIWSISDHRLIQFNVHTKAYKVSEVTFFGPYHPVLHGSYQDQEGVTWISTEVGLLEILPKPKPFHAACTDLNASRNLQFREIFKVGPGKVICRARGVKNMFLSLTFDEHLHADTTSLVSDISASGVYHQYGDALYHISSGKRELLRYSLTDLKVEKSELPADATTQFYNLFLIDDDGIIYYQDMQNQLMGFHPETKEEYVIPLDNENLKSPWRVLRFFGDDQVMIGSETMGLMFFDRKSGKLIKKYDQDSKPALSGNFINAIFQESDSILWVGTLGAGLNRLNIKKGTNKIYTKLDGLPDNMIASLLEDDKHNLWIGTYTGLSMFSHADHRFYNYFTADGLSDNEFNYLSSQKMDNGIILMGTLNGITLFNPNDIIGNDPLPPLQLTRIQRYNRRMNKQITEEHDLDPEHVIRVSPYDQFLDLSFAVPSFTNNTSHVFFSRLKGMDIEWQNHGRNPSVRYQHLPPGMYELELMAADAHGNKTRQPTVIRIYVEQVFYKSIWFLSLLMTFVLGIVWLMYQYRLRVLKQQQDARTRIASDLHDEVGGSLTGLYLQLQMMEMKASEQERASLGKANVIIHEAITKMRDLVWSIDARSDTWGKMLERMEDYASDVLSPLDIQVTIQHPTIRHDTPVDAKTKHNLYLIYKEAIHNIAKHSAATSVQVILERQTTMLQMIIQDNGTPSGLRQGSGQGLQNMHMRAARLKAKLHTGFNDIGFCTTLSVPMTS